MENSILKPCSCPSEFQDKTYGKNIRVHSVSADGKKAHCSVCEGSAKTAKRRPLKPGELVSSSRKYKSL